MANKIKMYVCKDVYSAYVEKLLRDNPEYWGKYGQRIKNCYIYVQRGNKIEEVISYPRFRKIVETYLSRAKYYIIEGWEVNLGNNLGVIAARRVERNFSRKVINHGETAKQPRDPETGKRTKIVYFTDPDWCRIGWKRSRKVKNDRFYQFSPSCHDMRGGGFKHEFNQALKKNPLLRYRYQYFPYVMGLE